MQAVPDLGEGGSGYLYPGPGLDRVGVRAHLSVNNSHAYTT